MSKAVATGKPSRARRGRPPSRVIKLDATPEEVARAIFAARSRRTRAGASCGGQPR